MNVDRLVKGQSRQVSIQFPPHLLPCTYVHTYIHTYIHTAMGIWDRWEVVLDTYRDVNRLFGDIVKVWMYMDVPMYVCTYGRESD